MLSGGVGSPSGAVPYSTRVNLVSVPIEGGGKSQKPRPAPQTLPALLLHPQPSSTPNTIVVCFAGVFNLQDPLARGVLVPGMGRHEGPIVKPVCRIVVRPGEEGARSCLRPLGDPSQGTPSPQHMDHTPSPQCSITPLGWKCLLGVSQQAKCSQPEDSGNVQGYYAWEGTQTWHLIGRIRDSCNMGQSHRTKTILPKMPTVEKYLVPFRAV